MKRMLFLLPLSLMLWGMADAPAQAQLPLRFTLGYDSSSIDGFSDPDGSVRAGVSIGIPNLPLSQASLSLYAELTGARGGGSFTETSLLGINGVDLLYAGVGVGFRSNIIATPAATVYMGLGVGLYSLPAKDKEVLGGKIYAGFEPIGPIFAEIGLPLIADDDFKPGLTASIGYKF